MRLPIKGVDDERKGLVSERSQKKEEEEEKVKEERF